MGIACVQCRDAASVEMERASMVDVQKAFEYKCLEADSREIYGPLADAFGRCKCIYFTLPVARCNCCV